MYRPCHKIFQDMGEGDGMCWVDHLHKMTQKPDAQVFTASAHRYRKCGAVASVHLLLRCKTSRIWFLNRRVLNFGKGTSRNAIILLSANGIIQPSNKGRRSFRLARNSEMQGPQRPQEKPCFHIPQNITAMTTLEEKLRERHQITHSSDMEDPPFGTRPGF